MSEEYSDTPSATQDDSDSEPLPYVDTPLPYVEEASSSSSNQRSTSSSQQAAPPTEEERLADTYQLGKVLKCYKGEAEAFTSDNLPSASLAVPTILICIGMFLIWGIWPIILFGMLILTPWLSTVIGRLPTDMIVALQDAEFYLCANGLMIIKWARVQAIRWEQIQGIRQNMTRDRRRYSYTLYLNEGKPVTLDRSLVGPEIRELSEVIECEISQRLLPDAIAAYEAGQTLNFGPVNVTAQGLTLEDEQQSLPWERFASVEDYNGYSITIKEIKNVVDVRITAIWQKIEIANMLNLCVFLPLVDHIKDRLHVHTQQSDGPISYETSEEAGAPEREVNSNFQEQPSAQEEELERMRRVHEEILERLRSRRRATPIPEEVVKALRVLDLSSDATFDEIHHRYRQLAKRYHPDMGGDPETFKRINAAYKCVITWIEAQNQKGEER